MFEALADAARAMGASEAGLEALWRRLRAVLLLGQITFAHKSVAEDLLCGVDAAVAKQIGGGAALAAVVVMYWWWSYHSV